MPNYVNRAKSPYVVDTQPAGILLLDHTLAEFLKKGFDEDKVDIKIGFPKTGWKQPSIYVSCPSYQLQPFLAYAGRKTPPSPNDKLTKSKTYNDDGTVDKVSTNITDHNPVIKEKTFLSVATTKISCYGRNYDETEMLARDAVSFVLMNFQFYLKDLNDNSDIKEYQDPRIRGVQFQNMHVDYNKDLAGVSKLYEISFILSIPYFVRITDQYTWITSMTITENIKEFTTDELLATNIKEL